VRLALCDLLADFGVEHTAPHRPAVLARLASQPSLCLLIMVESSLEPTELDLLDAVKQEQPDVAVLLLSRDPTIDHATQAIRRGAEDFVPVPYSADVLRKEVERILAAADLRERLATLDQLVATRFGFEQIVSRSPRMQPVFERALAASRSEAPALIIGETGTGKELLARAIHANSRRDRRPFVPVNCAALPAELIESELFGHRQGAFTGALRDHAGLLTTAHGGTLLLDEVGELKPDAQAKLLRVLQDGEVRPVGGLEGRAVDVRIIAATNRPLAALEDDAMRADLFFRLSVLVIEIPPLRERLDDLPALVQHFLVRALATHAQDVKPIIESEALDLLRAYPFPGNVRELENLVESVVVTFGPDDTTLRARDVKTWLRQRAHANRPAGAGGSLNLTQLEAWAIGEALRQTGGNKSRAARLLGLSRDTLYRKIQEHHLTV